MLAVGSRGLRKCWFKLPVKARIPCVYSTASQYLLCRRSATCIAPSLFGPSNGPCISAFYTFSTTSLSIYISGLTRRTVLRVSLARLAEQWWAATFLRYIIFRQKQVVDYRSFSEAVSERCMKELLTHAFLLVSQEIVLEAGLRSSTVEVPLDSRCRRVCLSGLTKCFALSRSEEYRASNL
ncbi:hypothetical protein CY34DRAFT_587731 [Suillus luteus UH-Slu-Lm8-n1]|uniref:Unplaced genomic scaffold CY34scaffold_503, whole genome shotgun sequence n=1 Tax=Suillus luteus UH-Slu-Lm8-n1 TaxID=930992 RepID=A0A0D0AB67_9AGAM|nr:hypothetical protein CY34DRAFT_587731 [Suillus luteus UH-Slu-Lm8-n1]